MRTRQGAQFAREHLEKMIGPLSFGRFVRVWRERSAWTQVAAAQKLHVSKATLCDIEKGRQLVSVELAHRIARVLGAPEAVAIACCLQDQLRKAKIGKWRVRLVA